MPSLSRPLAAASLIHFPRCLSLILPSANSLPPRDIPAGFTPRLQAPAITIAIKRHVIAELRGNVIHSAGPPLASAMAAPIVLMVLYHIQRALVRLTDWYMVSLYCLMAVVELGDYPADKPQRARNPIGSLRRVLIRGHRFPACMCVCVCVWMCVFADWCVDMSVVCCQYWWILDMHVSGCVSILGCVLHDVWLNMSVCVCVCVCVCECVCRILSQPGCRCQLLFFIFSSRGFVERLAVRRVARPAAGMLLGVSCYWQAGRRGGGLS